MTRSALRLLNSALTIVAVAVGSSALLIAQAVGGAEQARPVA